MARIEKFAKIKHVLTVFVKLYLRKKKDYYKVPKNSIVFKFARVFIALNFSLKYLNLPQ